MTQQAAVEAPPAPSEPAQQPQTLIARFLADRERAVCVGLVAFAVLFNAVFLLPELTSRPADLNDNVFHYLNLQRANEAVRGLDDPTEPWLSEIALGYPVFHYYQHLPYVVPAAVHVITSLPLEWLFHVINYVLLCLFPVSIYWSMRRFEFARPEAALAALTASLISTDGLFGFDFGSYVWAGYGLYTQLWGMLLLPPALALSYQVVRTGRGYLWAVLLLGATVMSHLAFGYVAFASIALFAVLSPTRSEMRARGPRALALIALTVGVTSYFLIPLALDSGYLNRSVWDPLFKYESFGAQQVTEWLLQGQLFDHSRFPVLTLLVGAGLITCGVLWRAEERYRMVALLFALWLLLYFGPKTWGGLLDATPLGRDFYFHRLIAGVHMAGIMLAGIGFAVPWRWLRDFQDRRYLAAFALAAAIALLPVYLERVDYLGDNRALMRQTSAAMTAEEQDIEGLLTLLGTAPPGRVYAGLAAQWGGQYRIGSVPMHAILTAHGFDNVGFLWHPWSLNGDVQVLFDEQRPELYDLFNIRYIVAPEDRTFPDFVQFVGAFGRHRLYRVDTTGFFDVVTSNRAFYADKESFYFAASNWLASAAPTLRFHPTLVFPGAPGAAGLPAGQPIEAAEYPQQAPGAPRPAYGSVLAEDVSSGRYVAVIDAPEGGTVILKQSYHPGWRAYVDGKEVTPRMVMPSYLAVDVGAGEHAVVFSYGPSAARHALQIAGVLILAAFLIDGRHRRRAVQALTDLRRRARL
ncbi:MAG: YfhO family protein [Dehalococcoidia bacterium]